MQIDLLVIFGYLFLVIFIGMKFAGARNLEDYFLGKRNIPWIIACFSIVATETSTLTFLSIPGLAYISGLGFLQVAMGYIVGRILVAVLLIPKYFEGRYETVYSFLQSRFGIRSRKTISLVFQITRLLADSVRLFATAIPLSLITGWNYGLCILVIGLATFVYTLYGGLRSVVVVDSIQLFLYLICACVGLFVISSRLGLSLTALWDRIPAVSRQIFYSGWGSVQSFFGSYNLFSGLIGGAFLSFASHGTDHLIVQRILACQNVKSAQKAMIWSGLIVFFQFFLFLILGLCIKELLQAQSFERSDEIVPYFILHYLPAGLRGLMLAGVFAAAMSTLSSSMNALSSATVNDFIMTGESNRTAGDQIKLSRLITFFWAVLLIGISLLLKNTNSPLVVIGLSIASVTYGGMLGIFLMGRFLPSLDETAAIGGVLFSIAINTVIAFKTSIFWLWFVVIGFAAAWIMTGLIELYIKKLRVGKAKG